MESRNIPANRRAACCVEGPSNRIGVRPARSDAIITPNISVIRATPVERFRKYITMPIITSANREMAGIRYISHFANSVCRGSFRKSLAKPIYIIAAIKRTNPRQPNAPSASSLDDVLEMAGSVVGSCLLVGSRRHALSVRPLVGRFLGTGWRIASWFRLRLLMGFAVVRHFVVLFFVCKPTVRLIGSIRSLDSVRRIRACGEGLTTVACVRGAELMSTTTREAIVPMGLVRKIS